MEGGVPDLGHPLRFGMFLPSPADQPFGIMDLALLAEQCGLDLIGVQDHPYNPDLLDCWTLLSHLAGATSTIALFPDVACLPLRPPAVLARSVAGLDLLSGGRVELGLGAGYFLDPIAGMGGPALTRGEAVDALEEAIGVIRAIWTSSGKITLKGRFHHLTGAAPGPRPAHDIGIWVGAYGKRMLSLTARLADGWVPSQAYADPAHTARLNQRIDTLAVDAGRASADIQRIYNINGRFSPHGSGFLDGPATVWAEQLTELAVTQGFSTFVLGAGDDPATAVSTFAQEVAPDVRQRVAAYRKSAELAPAAVADVANDNGSDAAMSVGGRHGGNSAESDRTAAAGPAPERDGNWGNAGGLPVTDRPRSARLDPSASGPVVGPDNHRNLVAIHDHLRSELEQIARAVEQVAAGDLAPGAARSLITRMTMRQNHWTLGSFCASYCRIVTLHHSIEDAYMFTGLAAAAPPLQPVLDRLEAEHHVIAEVLDRFDRALVDLVRERSGTEVPIDSGTVQIAALARELSDVLRSHLAYEEDELADGLAFLPAI